MIRHFCLLVSYKRDSTLHKTYIWWLQSTSHKRPPKIRRLCCRLRDVAWDRLSDSRDVAKMRCGDLGKRATPSLSFSRFSHLFLLHDYTIFEPGTGYLREVVAYESQPTGSDLAEEFQRHLLSEWEFIVFNFWVMVCVFHIVTKSSSYALFIEVQNDQPNKYFPRTWSVALHIPQNKRKFLREKIFKSPHSNMAAMK